MFFRWFKRILLVLVVIIVAVVLYLMVPVSIRPSENIKWGITFTKSYAEYLGLDWRQTYLAALDDLGVKAARVGINWDEIEPEPGQFDFIDYDWMFDQAEARGIEVLPAIGFKLPRWPECRAPKWVDFEKRDEFEQSWLAMVKEVVTHFQSRTSIRSWQVENEGFIGWFGDCPPISERFVRQEAELVRSLDARPILMTESGELSTGLKSAFTADIVGTTLYRQVWSKIFGFVTYPLPPSFYSHKANLLKPWAPEFIITELQLEAWAPKGILNIPIEKQIEQMPVEKIKEYIDYARRTGIDEIYAWGAEWWWWLKINGYPQLWETAREEFNR